MTKKTTDMSSNENLTKNTIEWLARKSGSEFDKKYEAMKEVMFDGLRLGVVEAMRLNGYGKYAARKSTALK